MKMRFSLKTIIIFSFLVDILVLLIIFSHIIYEKFYSFDLYFKDMILFKDTILGAIIIGAVIIGAVIIISKVLKSQINLIEETLEPEEECIDSRTLGFTEIKGFVDSFQRIKDKLREKKEFIRYQELEIVDGLISKPEIVTFDMDYKTTAMNITAVDTAHYDVETLIGRSIFEGVTEEVAEEIKGMVDEVIRTKKPNISYRNLDPREYGLNEERNSIAKVVLYPFLNDAGEVEEISLCTFASKDFKLAEKEAFEDYEIEKNKLEELFSERTNELDEAMQKLFDTERLASLGSLVSGVAHEINTPLGVAVSAASFLKELNDINNRKINEGHLSRVDFIDYIENVSQTLEILENNLTKAASLVNGFKLLAVQQTNEEKVLFNSRELVENIIQSLKYEYKNLDLEFKLEWTREVMILGDPGLYSQIFTNTIRNSIKHGVSNISGAEIRISLIEEVNELYISVSDNGIGIEKENLAKVFDPFYTTNRSTESAGLGLSVVYNIVTKQLGGKIKCESTQGAGTCINIVIPKP